MITKDEVFKLASEAGFVWVSQWNIPTCDNKAIQAFATAMYNKGLERTAEICDELAASHKRDVGGECDEHCDIVLGFDCSSDAIREEMK